MGKPHKHADLIKAWADGAEIQVRQYQSEWKNTSAPQWHTDKCWEYRIKPKTIKYRVGLFELNGNDWPQVYSNEETAIASEKHSVSFKRWLTDWQEVEV